MVMNDTVQRPGGDAGVVRVHGTNKAWRSPPTVPRAIAGRPASGRPQAVAEAYRNLSAVGARHWPSPTISISATRRSRRSWVRSSDAIQGMAKPAASLDFPVVSGNVSLYNETNGIAILPTPAIGAVGLIDDVTKCASVPFKEQGDSLIVIGETKGWLGCSLYLRELCGREDGAPPPVALHREKREGEFVRAMIAESHVTAVHDVSDGGLLVAAAEMAMASGIGVTIQAPQGSVLHGWCFGEDQGRYLMTAPASQVAVILEAARRSEVSARVIGLTGGADLILKDVGTISVEELTRLHEGWMPNFMAAPDTVA